MNVPAAAVILAAGEGTRLRPFTLTEPKCLATVAGRAILENALDVLAARACAHVTIVVGHLGDRVRHRIGSRHAGMRIEYVNNDAYATTNSMFSLALGLKGLVGAAWVLEGDVFLEPAVLDAATAADICWLVDSSTRSLDGAYVEADAAGLAREVSIVRDCRSLRPSQSKSIGVLRLSAAGAARVGRWLAVGIAAGQQQLYYDLILAAHLHEGGIHVADVRPARWFEIDTPDDLAAAAQVFQ